MNRDVGVGSAAVADAGDEVVVMGGEIDARGFDFLDQLVLAPEDLPAAGLAADDHAFGAVPGASVLVSFLHVRTPDALLVNELLLFSTGKVVLKRAIHR